MYVAMQFIQAKLHPMCTEDRALLNDSEFQAIKESDLSVLIAPYLIIGLIIVAMLLLIRFVKMPKNGDQNHRIDFLLDFHHSVWNTLVHVTRYGREKCGSTISTI